MAFEIVSRPLLSLSAEAVVNRANSGLQYAAGLCGEIFDAAGKLPLQRACVALGSCAVGSAVVTDGFGLDAKYIIHAVPPRWCGGKHGEDTLLADCYRSALDLAARLGSDPSPFRCYRRGFAVIPPTEVLRWRKKPFFPLPLRKP